MLRLVHLLLWIQRFGLGRHIHPTPSATVAMLFLVQGLHAGLAWTDSSSHHVSVFLFFLFEELLPVRVEAACLDAGCCSYLCKVSQEIWQLSGLEDTHVPKWLRVFEVPQGQKFPWDGSNQFGEAKSQLGKPL